MADSTLQDRLREHAKAFDGLLSLIPAKMYYGEDTSDQWKKKKQTKAEAAAARKAKLDPDSELNRNAKEVMDERAKNKRKLQEIQDEDDNADDVEGVEKEMPGQGLKNKEKAANKKQKVAPEQSEADKTAESLKRQERKAAKKDKMKEKKAAKKAETKAAKKTGAGAAAASSSKTESKSTKSDKKSESKKQKGKNESTDAETTAEPQQDTPAAKDSDLPSNDHDRDEDYETASSDDGDDELPVSSDLVPVDVSGLEENPEDSSASSPASEPQSPTFDTTDPPQNPAAAVEAASTTTSINSTIPPSEKPKHIKLPADTSALRVRLAARIEALRAARKADGPDGKPIRTRQELLETRRFKQAQRKLHKQELRRQAKAEEDLKREEALASNSPSVMSPGLELDDTPANFTFGRVGFSDNTQLSHDLSYVLSGAKAKGPSDPKTALLKLQNQKKRVATLDEEKQKDIADKEIWLTARRRAQGEKIRDDETLLKKAVKRKDTKKKKSEKEWKDRSQGVQSSIHQKQKKREENLRKRRDEKGGKGKKAKKGGAVKKKGRPGFEGGSFGGGKKK